MKKVLVSIKPQWGELIFNGKKTIKVMRNRPKLEPPFEVLVYETKGKTKYWSQPLPIPYTEGSGKVIGSFICDKITRYESEFWDDDTYERIQEPWEPLDFAEYGEYEYDTIGINGEFCGAGLELSKQSCLSWNELRNYVGQGLKDFYGWHITEPKLFDEPKELREFKHKVRSYYAWQKQGKKEKYFYQHLPLTRPPQSFCYVEDINEI